MKKIQYLIIALLCAVAQGAWAQTEVSTESTLTTALSGESPISVKLTADIALSEKLTISSGQTVTIDLNGKKLSRSLSANENYGMVIYVNGGTLTITDGSGTNSGSIEGGRSYNGAGILCESGSKLTINGGTFKDNDVSRTESGDHGRGGAIFMNPNTTLTITGGVFDGNSAYQGGAIYLDGGSATISGAEFKNCWVTGDGGAIYNKGTLSLTDCTISGNRATGVSGSAGGGIWNSSSSELTISGGTITGNECKGNGGGVNIHGNATISGCTITSNTAGAGGGGIYVDASGKTVTVSGSNSINSNRADSYGGGIYVYSGSDISMSGNPKVKDNENGNLYLDDTSVINVTGAFTSGEDGASIGVSLENGKYNRAITSGFGSNNGGAQPSDFFSADLDGATLSLVDGEAKLSASGYLYVECSWSGGDTDGHVVKTTKLATGVTNYTLTDNTNSYSNPTDLNDEWYLLSGTQKFNNRVACHGNVNFILQDGCDIEFNNGIHIDNGKTLNIYAQPGGTGKLKCEGGDDNAAIGGNDEVVGGNLIIHGGNITANSKCYYAAGIGGGEGEGSGMQSITIYGGTVSATGDHYGAAIGSGQNNNTLPTITIYGGTITATGDSYSAGIGGGENRSNGTITIYGGNITATGGDDGAGIGGGDDGDMSRSITIYGGTVTATGGANAAGIGGGDDGQLTADLTIYGGTVTANGGKNGAGIGGGEDGGATGTVTIKGGNVTASGGQYAAGIGGGLNGGNGEVIIYDGSTVTATGGEKGAGIGGGEGGSMDRAVTIYGGTVNATGGDYGAGIGGGSYLRGGGNMTGDVIIYGGTVTASGGPNAAGIGTGNDLGNGSNNVKQTGSIIIYNGTVTANGSQGAAAIGGGFYVSGGPIQIHGGHVYANAGSGASAIGGGAHGNGGTVTIDGGYVEAKSKGDAAYIGGGSGGSDGTASLGSGMMVSTDGSKATAANNGRESACQTHPSGNSTLTVTACDHSGEKSYKYKDEYYHTVSCDYCTGTDEAHVKGSDNKCTGCGTDLPTRTLTFYEAKSDGSGYSSTGTAYYVTEEVQDFTFPECGTVPSKKKFVGWEQATSAPSSLTMGDNESTEGLKQPGDVISLPHESSDRKYYARYKKVYFSGGKGTSGDPFVISKASDLLELAEAVNAGNSFKDIHLKMTADLSFNSYTPIGTSNRSFRGTFDGQSHSISGINITQNSEYQGVFGNIGTNGTVKNLKLMNSTIKGKDYVGGIAGQNSGTIENCHVTSNVIIEYTEAKDIFGGIAGATDGTVSGCTSAATVNGGTYGEYVGGIVGLLHSGTVSNCLYLGSTVSGKQYVGAIVGGVQLGSTTITSNYYVSGSKGVGSQSSDPDGAKKGYTVMSGTDGLTINFGTATKTYSNNGIKVYDSGLSYGGRFYSGSGQSVTITPEADKQIASLTANEDALTANTDGTYTLTMPSADVTIRATFSNYAITLHDGTIDPTNTTTIDDNDGHVADVTISGRTLYKDGGWNTLCLPFDVEDGDKNDEICFTSTPLEGATVMELDVDGTYNDANGDHQTGFSDGTLYLYFKNASKIKAGKPYIVKWASGDEITNLTFSNVVISNSEPNDIESADGKVSFVGNYDPAEINGNSCLYLGSGDKLYYPSAARTIKSFRAYFQLHGITAGDLPPQAVRMFFGDDSEQTGITTTNYTNYTNFDNSWYSLDGRKLSGKPTAKGVYIYKGIKRVIK